MKYNKQMYMDVNTASSRGRRLLAGLLALVAALLALASCDYPEEGYFQLELLDEKDKVFAIYPFRMRELVDDTSLTYGFALQIPRAEAGQIVELELKNGSDLSKRSWHLDLATPDSGAGDVSLELTHINERMSFVGLFRPWAEGKTFDVGGYVLSGGELSTVVFNGLMPPVPFGPTQARRIEIRRIDKAEFEDYLGSSIEKAEILKAGAAPMLLPDASDSDYTAPPPQSADKPREEKKQEKTRPKPPPMGGRY
jgi:hypothetical protein